MHNNNYWLRLGSFLIGYNFNLVKSCSELAAKRVKKYTSALLIVMMLWAMIGFAFSERYLKTDLSVSIIAGIVMIIFVIQIERQIILAPKGNIKPMLFRLIIGILMAIVGSVILDQIIFKEDIEQKKLELMDAKVRKIFPGRAEELKRQVHELDSTITAKEIERKAVFDDVSRNPTITIFTRSKTVQGNGLNPNDSTRTETVTRSSSQIQNPKIAQLQPLDDQIAGLRDQKIAKDNALLALRPAIEEELKAKNGFLDELEVLIAIVSESKIAFWAWIIWFVLLIALELFIVVSKLQEDENDYDRMLHQQMELHLRRIELLGRQ